MPQQPPMWLGFTPVVVWIVIGIGFAIGNYFLNDIPLADHR